MRRVLSFIFYLIALVVYAGGIFGFAGYCIETMRTPEPDQPFQAAAVFFEGLDREHELSQESTFRLNAALHLYRQKLVQKIACLGGAYTEPRGSELMQKYLIEHRVPEEAIFRDTTSYDTYSNIRSLARLIEEQQWERVVLVSSPFHLFRITSMAKDSLMLQFSSLTLYPFSTRQDKIVSLATAGRVHHELVGWAAYELLPNQWYRWLVRELRASET